MRETRITSRVRSESGPQPRRKTRVSLNLNKLVDKAYEDKTINELLDAPPSALEGLTPRHDELLAELKIKTVRDLGNWKYAGKAAALLKLAENEA